MTHSTIRYVVIRGDALTTAGEVRSQRKLAENLVDIANGPWGRSHKLRVFVCDEADDELLELPAPIMAESVEEYLLRADLGDA